MTSFNDVLDRAGVEYSFRTADVARKAVAALQRAVDRGVGGFMPPEQDRKSALLDPAARKLAIKHRGEPLWRLGDVQGLIVFELTTPGIPFSTVTRGSIKVSEQIVEATEVLERAEKLFNEQLSKFTAASENAVKSAKQRVSQLNDYNSRLASSLAALNKTLGDERMVAALNNAERLAAALELLDKLESTGKLDKIMAAMNAK